MVSRVATPMVVHADHKSFGGYRSAANSASFCKALLLSAKPSLAIPWTFDVSHHALVESCCLEEIRGAGARPERGQT